MYQFDNDSALERMRNNYLENYGMLNDIAFTSQLTNLAQQQQQMAAHEFFMYNLRSNLPTPSCSSNKKLDEKLLLLIEDSHYE